LADYSPTERRVLPPQSETELQPQSRNGANLQTLNLF